MVVDRQLEVTLRAGEPRSSWMLGPHVDPLVVDGHLDPAHLPRWEESQQVPVELGVTHHTIVADHPRTDPANTSSQKLPTQNPEAPRKRVTVAPMTCFMVMVHRVRDPRATMGVASTR